MEKIRTVFVLLFLLVSVSFDFVNCFVVPNISKELQNARIKGISRTRLNSTLNQWETNLADSALRNVQKLASSVTRANEGESNLIREDDDINVRGTGDTKYVYSYLKDQVGSKGQNRQVVVNALQCLERDSEFAFVCFYIYERNQFST